MDPAQLVITLVIVGSFGYLTYQRGKAAGLKQVEARYQAGYETGAARGYSDGYSQGHMDGTELTNARRDGEQAAAAQKIRNGAFNEGWNAAIAELETMSDAELVYTTKTAQPAKSA